MSPKRFQPRHEECAWPIKNTAARRLLQGPDHDFVPMSATRRVRSVGSSGLQDQFRKSGGVEQHPFSQCLDGVGKPDVVSPRDDAEHAALGLLGKPMKQGRIAAIDPGKLAVARGARAALNGRHSLGSVV